MSRRIKVSRDQHHTGRTNAAEPLVSQSENGSTHGKAEPEPRRVLAEYFVILQEWSLKSQPEDNAVDSCTSQP